MSDHTHFYHYDNPKRPRRRECQDCHKIEVSLDGRIWALADSEYEKRLAKIKDRLIELSLTEADKLLIASTQGIRAQPVTAGGRTELYNQRRVEVKVVDGKFKVAITEDQEVQ